MNEVLRVALGAMQADMARLDQVAMNLANALTPGYKRAFSIQTGAATSFAAQLVSMESLQAGALTPGAQVVAATDARTGTLKFTGQPLDIAVAGSGFFEVMTDAGPAYTRDGSFHADERGRLVNQMGHAVMGFTGEISIGAASPAIDQAGAIRAGTGPDSAVLARIKVVEFEAPGSLPRLGEGLFAPGAGMKVLAEENVQLRQGYLENSNVNSTHEMRQLIQTMRHFESMQKVAQGYDEMLGNAIRRLGEG